jgi:biotin synthase
MTEEEILASATLARDYGYGTVVMQAGEDFGITREWMAHLIRRIKAETGRAITLSLGERPFEDLEDWREAGADRYLLRFETSDRELYRLIHPSRPGTVSDRIAILRQLQALGYEAGSGVLIGIPGQTYDNLADDILLFRELDLDMIGMGPFIPHPETPLGRGECTRIVPAEDQVPPTEHMTYKAVALTRLMCPEANIPSTTALATINKANGREYGLMRGANVVMPNLTPPRYRALYEIYPAKACIDETAAQCQGCLFARIKSIGREVGKGPGGRARSGEGLRL